MASCGKLKEEYLTPNNLKKQFEDVFKDCEKKGIIPHIQDMDELKLSVNNSTEVINPSINGIFERYLETVNVFPVLREISQLGRNVLDYCKNLFEVSEDSDFGSQLFTTLDLGEEKEEPEEGDKIPEGEDSANLLGTTKLGTTDKLGTTEQPI